MRKRKTFNPKRRIRVDFDEGYLSALSVRVSYGGNPEHKRHPGDFDLTPPSAPCPDKTLCDGVGVFRRSDAESYLKTGIAKGLISVRTRGDFPQNVWFVTNQGFPLEAQLENRGQGVYHGYPMPRSDPFRDVVIERWRTSK